MNPAVESTLAEPTGSLATALSNRFLVVILTSQRAKQLENGARPRVDGGDHKPPGVALLEVLGGLISWSVTEPSLPEAPRAGKG